MGPAAAIDHGWATACGPRSENQDRGAAAPAWLVVSDGIGGHAGGATAAALTVDAVAAVLAPVAAPDGVGPEDLLAAAVARANDAVRAGRAADPAVADMGATVVLAVADPAAVDGSRWLVASVGDSPAWVARREGVQQLTHDDNVAGELARTGAITAEAAEHHPGRHLLLRAMGLEATVAVTPIEVVLGPGDALVLASDGLSGVLGPADIHAAIATAPTMAGAAATLVERSLQAGTRDNVTVAAVRRPG
ncbi:protein phosphatase 2C domain-containing protein [Aquihabitans sp. G128]|uniref:PP2C family protein-serine/threonine phosphatase n=1 Tax=Aquihabitans sp. G128 TaxID=2849779 RepID=UPI001C22BFEF|nr:protein phosphatase 2C domain-containing protein [Aquihabitans sp. G128]QXC63047.1 protein phosphatase 2C domain-containing protein [Aquihabitans sp. G128]